MWCMNDFDRTGQRVKWIRSVGHVCTLDPGLNMGQLLHRMNFKWRRPESNDLRHGARMRTVRRLSLAKHLSRSTFFGHCSDARNGKGFSYSTPTDGREEIAIVSMRRWGNAKFPDPFSYCRCVAEMRSRVNPRTDKEILLINRIHAECGMKDRVFLSMVHLSGCKLNHDYWA